MHKLAQQVLAAKASAASGHRKTPPDGISCDPSEDTATRLSLPSWAHGYRFTGTLRPTLISPRREIPMHIRRPDYANDPAGVSMSGEQYRNSCVWTERT